MKRVVIISVVSLTAVISGIFLYRSLWRPIQPEAMVELVPSLRKQFAKQTKKTDEAASLVVEKWNRAPVVPLNSPELEADIARLPENGYIELPPVGMVLEMKDLPDAAQKDLDKAIYGFLLAYESGTSSTVLDYMHERDKTLSKKLRPVMEKALIKRGVSNPATLDDDELYKTMWATFRSNAHWHGLALTASCRQLWDGKRTQLDRVQQFDTNSTASASPQHLEQAARLFRLFRGHSAVRHNFEPAQGSIEESYERHDTVLLCDVQLVVDLDDTRSHLKAAYLCRFWFNTWSSKWQPICLIGFASDPQKVALPALMF